MYRLTLIYQEKPKNTKRWKTTDTRDYGERPYEDWKMATSTENMKFGRKFGKQQTKRYVEDGKQVLVLESWNQTASETMEYRILHVYREI